MYVFPKKVTSQITVKQKVQYDLQHRCVTPQLNMEFNAAFVFFKSFSAKQGKKGKEKRNDYSVIEQNALKPQLYGKYFKRFASKNDRSK